MQMEGMWDSPVCTTGAGGPALHLVDGRAIMEINGDQGPQTLGQAHRGAVGSPSLDIFRQQQHKALSHLMLALL